MEDNILAELQATEGDSDKQQEIIDRYIETHGKLRISESPESPVTLMGVEFHGDVEFYNASLSEEIFFHECSFYGGIKLIQSIVETISFSNSFFSDAIVIGRSKIKILEITGCTAGNAILLGKEAKVTERLEISECKFDGLVLNELEQCKKIILDQITIEQGIGIGKVHVENIEISNLSVPKLTLEHCTIAEDAILDDMGGASLVEFSHCNVGSSIVFHSPVEPVEFALSDTQLGRLELIPSPFNGESSIDLKLDRVEISRELLFTSGKHTSGCTITRATGEFDIVLAPNAEFGDSDISAQTSRFQINRSSIGEFSSGDGVSFVCPVSMKSVEFNEIFEAKNNKFGKQLDFDSCVFKKNVILEDTEFVERASFKLCVFEHNASFENANFFDTTDDPIVFDTKDDAMFVGTRFDGVTILTGAQFKVIPNFAETIFGHDLEIERMEKLPWQLLYDTAKNYKEGKSKEDELNEEIIKLARLKSLAQQAQNYELEMRLFAIESKLRTSRKGWQSGAANFAYDIASDYGQSLMRPLRLLATSFMLFATIYMFLSADFGWLFGELTSFDLNMLLVPISISILFLNVGLFCLWLNYKREQKQIVATGRHAYKRVDLGTDIFLFFLVSLFSVLFIALPADSQNASSILKSIEYTLPFYKIYTSLADSASEAKQTNLVTFIEYVQFLTSVILQFLFLLGVRNRFRITT